MLVLSRRFQSQNVSKTKEGLVNNTINATVIGLVQIGPGSIRTGWAGRIVQGLHSYFTIQSINAEKQNNFPQIMTVDKNSDISDCPSALLTLR